MLAITNLINNAKVVRAATAVNIGTWLGQAVIAFTHDASGNHSVEGYPEHLQLALITLCALTIVPITLPLGAMAGTGVGCQLRGDALHRPHHQQLRPPETCPGSRAAIARFPRTS